MNILLRQILPVVSSFRNSRLVVRRLKDWWSETRKHRRAREPCTTDAGLFCACAPDLGTKLSDDPGRKLIRRPYPRSPRICPRYLRLVARARQR